MASEKLDLPQGTLDLLILKTVALEPQHGWAISERVQQISQDVLQIQQGSLYPALHRLERRGWIKARWGSSENNRRAKYYELTAAGRKQLEREQSAWNKLAAAVAQVLRTAQEFPCAPSRTFRTASRSSLCVPISPLGHCYTLADVQRRCSRPFSQSA